MTRCKALAMEVLPALEVPLRSMMVTASGLFKELPPSRGPYPSVGLGSGQFVSLMFLD